MLQKGTRTNLITKGKTIFEIVIPIALSPSLRKRLIASYVVSQAIMHLSEGIEQEMTILQG